MSDTRLWHPNERRWETNLLIVVTLSLTTVGLIACYSAATYMGDWAQQASQQQSAALIGMAGFVVAASVDYNFWRRWAGLLLLGTVALLAILAVVALLRGPPATNSASGLDRIFPYINGARRWIHVGFQVQVSELARFTLVAYLAAFAAEKGEELRDLQQGFLPAMGIILGVAALVAVEPSVTMAMTLVLIGTSVIFIAGVRISHLLPLILAGPLGLAVLLKVDRVRGERLAMILQPALSCSLEDDQTCNSLLGMGNGGIFGVGFGQGTQQMGHIRYGYSDFILSIVGEQFGMIGVLFIGLLFTLFCWAGLRIARTARDRFGTYLAGGLTFGIIAAALIHAMVVLRMLIPTGIPLPFISAGRLSLIVSLFSAGVVVSVGQARGRPASRR